MVKPFSERNLWEITFSTPAAIFYCTLAEQAYRASGVTERLGNSGRALAALLARAVISFWVIADASDDGRPTPYDFGSFVFFLPLLALIYLFVRYGRRGFVPLGWYLLITLAAVILAWSPIALAFALTHHRNI